MGEWSQRVFLTSSCRTILVLVIITFGMDRISVPHFLFVEVNCTSITQQTELLCNAGSSGLIIVDINNNIKLYVHLWSIVTTNTVVIRGENCEG